MAFEPRAADHPPAPLGSPGMPLT